MKLFEDIIGQDMAKRRLAFYVESYMHTRIIPSIMLVSPKGNGKTSMARALAKALPKFDEEGKVVHKPTGGVQKKTFLEVNCSTIKSVKAFFTGLIQPHVQDKDVTILFDEASELPHDVSMALLTILNPNPTNRTTFSYDDYNFEFDLRRQTFLFATSESSKLFHALADRLKRVDLEEYTLEHLSQIMRRSLKEVTFKDNVLADISLVLRGNARAAQMMANDIELYLRGDKVFTREHWDDMRQIFGILPLGLSAIELNYLRLLGRTIEGTSLTKMSACTGMGRESLLRDVELYLMKLGLMYVETSGRKITPKGVDYLKAIPA